MGRKIDAADQGNSWFTTTRWTVVFTARDEDSGSGSLNQLCQTYWFPLYAYARRRGNNHNDAEDLTQDFFCRLLERRFLDGIDPAKGRFRSFLLVSMQRHMAATRKHQTAQKRGGQQMVLSLDMQNAEGRYLQEPAASATPETLFEKHWALLLLGRVIDHLGAEYAEAGKAELFEHLKPFLTGDAERADYAKIVQQFGSTESAMRMNVSRMRKRYRELLRLQVAQTVASEEDIDAEIAHLRSILRG